jgi:hypothetical protein
MPFCTTPNAVGTQAEVIVQEMAGNIERVWWRDG